MKRPTQFDFVYAVRHTKILCAPERLLEAFDQTSVKYTLLAEPMDNPNQTRVREGTLQTFPPRLMLPGDLSSQELEGFGEQARSYLEFLKTHAAHIRVLQYSYRLRRESYTETLLNEPLEAVRTRAEAAFARKQDPYAALVVHASVPATIKALESRSTQDLRERLPGEARQEFEQAFAAAVGDPSVVKQLGRLLKERGVFELYQDRFFALIR